NYQVYFQRLSNRDSVGFILLNTHKIPVTYLVFDGKKVIAAATSSNSEILWKKVQRNERKLYTVQYSFVWGGKQIVRNEKIGLLYKMVDISVQHQSKIFPGQKDSITVTVKDYKNKAVENFNLTAVAYNGQLSKYIYLPELPYLAKYTQRKSIDRGKYEMESEDAFFTKKYPLYKHPKWISKMGLDTLLYYQLLFPKSSNTDVVIPISKFIPEASIHVVDKGMPQPIYLLYINQEIVYYNAVKAIMPYSFKVNSFYNKIGIRLIDKYIEIDSVYIQPNYKHDIVFDLQQLPAQATVIECPKQFTNNEVSIIERSFLQLDNRINAGYLWQKNSVFNIQKNEDYNSLNIIGPLNTFDSVHYFLPKIFDVHFKFEPGYFYHLSNKVIRLEKKSIFPYTFETNQYNLPEIKHFTWQHLGDTIINNPTIYYEPFVANKVIKIHERNTLSELFTNKHLTGKLSIKTPKDTTISYSIIETFGTHKKRFIYAGCIKHFTQLHPEIYTITYITSNWLVAEKKIFIQKNTTLHIHENSWHFAYNNALIDSLFEPPIKETKPIDISLLEFDKSSVKASLNTYPYTPSTAVKEKGILKIKVLDIIGKNPIPHVAAFIKNTKQSYLSDINGELTISNVKPGKYTISISTIGYQMLDIEITIEERLKIVTVQLQQSTSNLDEVVVVGYGMTRKKDMTASMSVVKSNQLFNNNNALTLQGKVAGVQINGNAGSATNITIRGMKSLEKENILYVIDGILYDEMPEEITPEIIDKIETLNSKEATNLYGLRAASGAIVISTKNKTLRTIFRDYAFWQPELITNSEGKVAFTVNYPDNITSWDAYFLGMDAKNRIGKLNTRIQSYKPIMAQLSIPTFLIEGDSTHVINKILNHTNDPYQLTATFSVNNILQATKKITAAPNASVIIPFEITGEKDTVQNSFEIITNTGFKDGEERKIPVFKKGMETTIGNFWILQKDTTLKIEATQKAGTLKISAVNNTLDVLLDEIEQVKKYPYYCMEQTASKLRSLLMEKTIKHALHKKFADEATIKQLTKRILDGQNFNGGWGWWQAGKANIHITNYVIEILQEFKENTLLNTCIRNGLLYLQNQLDYLGKDELLQTLCILSESNHAIQYEPYLKRFEFDSLTIHQQWQWVRLLQNLKLDYSKQIDTLLYKANKSMLGSMY
ncbi:MAG: carboxypeptidase-like regulatory domain-containing protein, partial [Chitinophagaceae bacterium]